MSNLERAQEAKNSKSGLEFKRYLKVKALARDGSSTKTQSEATFMNKKR